ncbi:hypothetical protein FCIRC_13521, partial [Fusarium circinatum]
TAYGHGGDAVVKDEDMEEGDSDAVVKDEDMEEDDSAVVKDECMYVWCSKRQFDKAGAVLSGVSAALQYDSPNSAILAPSTFTNTTSARNQIFLVPEAYETRFCTVGQVWATPLGHYRFFTVVRTEGTNLQ